MEISPRPNQKDILDYTHGTMGISAVPGSGKTWTLSALAAKLIQSDLLSEDQEILIVTLTNSAVDNFSTRINEFLTGGELRNIIPPYCVRTLHGLAHDIVRERPDLVGLDSQFTIIDERAADQLRNDISVAWLHTHSNALDSYLHIELDGNRQDWVRNDLLPVLVKSISLSFIRTAKDLELTPAEIKSYLDLFSIPLPLAEMGADIYGEYQRALAYRGAVDFDDLIRLALLALSTDPNYLNRLQNKWPYILEDEAQDSSLLQEKILKLLVSKEGNWARVGDPNQAIYESFTTASPEFLKKFIRECDSPQKLPNSGRSTPSIIELANHLIEWSRKEHPNPLVRDTLDLPLIELTPNGDPQPNPKDRPDQIHLVKTKYTPQGELEAVADSLERWLPNHTDETVAVLVPRNMRGFALIDLLRERHIDVIDNLLRSSSTTRFAAGALGNLLRYLADPGNSRRLATVYQVWRRKDRENPDLWSRVVDASKILENCHRVEDYIWPRPGHDWLDDLDLNPSNLDIIDSLSIFREYIRRWQGTVLMPVNQMILTLAQDIFDEPTELAIAHKLAVLLRQVENSNPDWRLLELAGELAVIARNERRFLGFNVDDTGFNPDNYKGQVVVATVHKAKGLEWDRVYLMSVNNYDFPSGMEYDRYIPEKWFIRDGLNLEAETLAQLKNMLISDSHNWLEEGIETQGARLEYVRERLRLLYVGITRAKKELVVTWNSGRKGDLGASLPFVDLQAFWEKLQIQRY